MSIQLEKGKYYPLRVIFANTGKSSHLEVLDGVLLTRVCTGGVGSFSLKIEGPNGMKVVDEASGVSDALVQFSCDGKNPKFGKP